MISPQQLVSIVIITYNSAKFILETLESAKMQSFQNIELIVSDDYSSDNTIDICEKWLSENDSRFVKSTLITTDANSGIAPNCNRGVKAATGNWIKIIAGDDLLLPNCISDNISFIEKNTHMKFVFSNMIMFTVLHGNKQFFERLPLGPQKTFFNTSAAVQYYNLIMNNMHCPAPASFINRETLVEVGMFDERFPFIEDYPMWVTATFHNYPLYYFDIDTVLYRKGESVTQLQSNWTHRLLYESAKRHFKTQVAKDIKSKNLIYYFAKKAAFFKIDILINLFQNKKNILSKLFNYLFDLIFLNLLIKLSKLKKLPKTYF